MYELIIIGAGPAGISAGIYAARKKIKTALITDAFGGQSVLSDNIQNWIGTKSISGAKLALSLEEHLRDYEKEIDIISGDFVIKVEKPDNQFKIYTKSGKTFDSKTLLVAAGSSRRKLGIPGEEKFIGKGVFYCSICDAALLKGKNAVVIGGGNAGLEAVRDLIPYSDKIYLLEFLDKLKGDAVNLEKIKNNAKVEIITMARAAEILGDKFVTGLKYEDRKTKEIKELKAEGIFIEIGSAPNSDFVKDLVALNELKEIIVDSKTQKTSQDGIWAAGDISDGLYKQNNIAAGDAIKAILNIYDWLKK